MKEKTDDPNFAYASNNVQYDKDGALDDQNQAHLGRFADPEGMRAEGKNYVAFSLILDHGSVVDYDSDYFPDEESARNYLSILKNNGEERKGAIFPVEQESEIETKIINVINTGNTNTYGKADGALPPAGDTEGMYN